MGALMRLATVRRLVICGCLLVLCGCPRRDSEEVARLKKELEAARAELARSKPPDQGAPDNKKIVRPRADGKVYRTAKELLADMPEKTYPKYGEKFGIERARCRTWCRANLPGRTVEFTATVNDKIQVSGNGPFLVRILPDGLTIESGSVDYGCLYFGEPVSLGDEKYQVVFYGATFYSGVFGFEYHCTEAEADQLRKLTGKKVTFRTTVIEDPNGREKVEDRDGDGRPVMRIYVKTLGPPSIDGFLPEADKPKNKK
jgi:hypothetical protein